MNYYSRGSYSIVGFNKTGKGKDWKQSSGTGIAITKNIAARNDKEGNGFDPAPIRLSKWTWVRIKEKEKELTVVISAYKPCKNKKI